MLKNEHSGILPHSDFFGPVETALAPRAAQVAVVRAAHALIQDHARRLDLADHVGRIEPRSEWPRTANLLLLEAMRPVLAAPGRSPAFAAALDRLVAARILCRYDRPKGRLRQLVARFRYASCVIAEAGASPPREPPSDILDVLLSVEPRMSDDSLVHLCAAFVFALVSSVALALSWAVLLAVRHGAAAAPPRHLVQEALRLYPIAWLLERRTTHAMDLCGERLGAGDLILVSPYAVHRNPLLWDEPTRFRPERWDGRIDRRAWIPLGVGSQSCIAASLSMEIASELLAAILARPAAIELIDQEPSVRPALAPPRFTLVRS